MAFVYFSDADKVVHKVPSDLTHFEPNDESDPYVLDKVRVNFASGRSKVVRVHKGHFEAIQALLDEANPSFNTDVDVECVADFVRYMGSGKTVPVIVNAWLYSYEGYLNKLIIDASSRESIIVQIYVGETNKIARLYEHLSSCCTSSSANLAYLRAVIVLTDVCEHTRDMIDYVRTSTNELYAKRLDGFLVQIDKLLADLNPTGHLFAMKWLMNDFEKIPRRIRDDWLASE
jgi:hypothetical protein